ncbi:MAG: AsmA family protein, partial [Deltaproteobacteria bacterium]|nr:AsmA family protein [Deltaproteobacteria bacterium]
MELSQKRLLVSLTVVVSAALIVFSLGLLAEKRRGQVQEELQKLLGNDVTLDAVETRLWGGMGFTVKNFRIADNPRYAATPFVHAEKLQMGVSFWHLFLGRIMITSLVFTKPEFQFITDEEGSLNISALAARRKSLAAFPKLRTDATGKNSMPVSFLVTRIRVIDGRVDFIDRSVRAPAELRIKNIDLDVGGVDLAAKARIKLAASLTEGLGRDMRIEGDMGPVALGRGWSQQPVNLEMQFDSLYLPMLARAIPYLRDRLPRELDVTGPMYFQARLTGTFQQPHFASITLKVPFLGSSEYNAVLEGRASFTESRDWAEAAVTGELSLRAIRLAQLRKLPLLQQLLPAAFATSGSVNILSRFEGTWNQLRIGALLEVGNNELRQPGWLQKPAESPALLRAQLLRNNRGIKLYPSELKLGNTKVLVSGALTQDRNSRLSIKLSTTRGSLTNFEPLLAPGTLDALSGTVDGKLALEKNLTSTQGGWQVQGNMNLDQIQWRHKASGTKIDQLSGSMVFSGNRARAPKVSFRLGSSAMTMTLDVADLNRLSGTYTLRSDDLNLKDIPAFAGGNPGRMKEVFTNGEMTMDYELPRIRGTLSSPEGTLRSIPYRKLRTDFAWSPAGVSFEDLRVAAFDGELNAGGSWDLSDGQARNFRLTPRIDALNMKGVLAQLAPDVKDRFDGQLDFQGDFDIGAPSDGALAQTLKGSGTALIRKGRIRNFNLIARLFFRNSGQNGSGKETQRAPDNLTVIVKREDTPLKDFKATVIVEAQRVSTANLSISTSEYTITGAGWINFDGVTRWNGMLVFSPGVTQELQREYTALRYFIDRKGRLTVAFRLDG